MNSGRSAMQNGHESTETSALQPPATDGRKFNNVFVLGTGRCDTLSFAKACEVFSNFTSGHETRCQKLGDERLDYPLGHIEADNRLSWMLGRLDRAFGDSAFYVHLTRDPNRIAESYSRRWDHRYSIVAAYNRSILKNGSPVTGVEIDLVETITANIELFLRDKTNVMCFDITESGALFEEFAERIGATGDIAAAQQILAARHNRLPTGGFSTETPKRDALSLAEANFKPQQKMIANNEGALHDLKETREKLTKIEETTTRQEIEPSIRLTAERKKRHKLELKVAILEGERTHLRKKLVKSRRRLRIALAPWAILFFPITLAVFGLRLKKINAAARAKNAPKPDGEPPIGGNHSSADRNHLAKCMDTLSAEGTQKALEELRERPHAVPWGVENLFLAYDAADDEEWLRHMNTWLKQNSNARLLLRPGCEPRFNRMYFEQVTPNSDPSEKITVILPAFNSEELVEAAALSILNQTWSNLELIAINDCSSDRTGEVLDRIALDDPRMRVLHNPVNVGPYVSKNIGLSLATGDYVTGHDADDLALPDRLERQIEVLLRDPKAVGVIGYMIRMSEQGLFNHVSKWPTNTSYNGVQRLASISLLIRRSDLLRVGYWDCVRFGADSEMIARLQKVFVGQIRKKRILTMLCLNEAGSLTNNAEHGISPLTGVSAIRKNYREAWKRWHACLSDASSMYLGFDTGGRLFNAPQSMIVPEDNIRLVRSAHLTGN